MYPRTRRAFGPTSTVSPMLRSWKDSFSRKGHPHSAGPSFVGFAATQVWTTRLTEAVEVGPIRCR
jgi:hypothetical protein